METTGPAGSTLRVTSHHQYTTADDISPETVAPCPLAQFREWFQFAQAHVPEPEAMTLCTCAPGGAPSARIVLLKQADAAGFVFFTNYGSRKSRELDADPRAALALYWREVHRQVRVVGRAERVSEQESDAYFATRPLGSRIGAWASPQSEVVHDGELPQRVLEVERRFGVVDGKEDVPRPPFWGGWRIVPSEVEFWVGKPSRLHDRVRYTRKDEASPWLIEKLAP